MSRLPLLHSWVFLVLVLPLVLAQLTSIPVVTTTPTTVAATTRTTVAVTTQTTASTTAPKTAVTVTNTSPAASTTSTTATNKYTVSFYPMPTVTACAYFDLTWILTGDNATDVDIDLSISNNGINQDIPASLAGISSTTAAASTISALVQTSSTSAASGVTTPTTTRTTISATPTTASTSTILIRSLNHRTLLNINQSIVTSRPSNVNYNWLVSVPEGRYYISAHATDGANGRSEVFTVLEGANTTCLAGFAVMTSSLLSESAASMATAATQNSGVGASGGGKGLSGGAIAGIVVGVVVALVVVGILLLLLRRRREKRWRTSADPPWWSLIFRGGGSPRPDKPSIESTQPSGGRPASARYSVGPEAPPGTRGLAAAGGSVDLDGSHGHPHSKFGSVGPAVIEEQDDSGKTTTGSSEEEGPSVVLGKPYPQPGGDAYEATSKAPGAVAGAGAPLAGKSTWQGWDGKVDSVEMQERMIRHGSVASDPIGRAAGPSTPRRASDVTPPRSRKSSLRKTSRPSSMMPLSGTSIADGIGNVSPHDRRMSSPTVYTPSGPTRHTSSSGSPRPPGLGHRAWSSQGASPAPMVSPSTPLEHSVPSQYANGGEGDGGANLARRPSGSIRRKPVPALLGEVVQVETPTGGNVVEEVPPLPERTNGKRTDTIQPDRV